MAHLTSSLSFFILQKAFPEIYATLNTMNVTLILVSMGDNALITLEDFLVNARGVIKATGVT